MPEGYIRIHTYDTYIIGCPSCHPTNSVKLALSEIFKQDLLPPPRRICNRHCLFVCLLATLRKNFQKHLHEIFREGEGWQWASEQMTKFWWQSGSPPGYRDCFPDSSLLGDMESG